MSTNDGGPAFPASIGQTLPGMSLRDYFAAQVLVALSAMIEDRYVTATDIAAQAYHIADALLSERARVNP